MSRRTEVEMTASARRTVRAGHHPARAVPCPHCGAGQHRPCRGQKRTRFLPAPHPSRVAAWARAAAVCPTCQVEPGVSCHDQGLPLTSVHARRTNEARRWVT